MTELSRVDPSVHGVDGAKVVEFLDACAAAGIELHSLMLLKHGAVVAEGWWAPYSPTTPHLLYSLSKSFASVAAGIAESEGLLAMDDTLAAHLPEAADYGTATIADALRMSVGHLRDPILDPRRELDIPDDASLRRLLADYAPERPAGEIFTYDQLATFAVAKIVERRSGQSLIDYLRPRVLEPLGAHEAKWYGGDANPGFTGLYLNTESIAAFGQLLLQHGEWRGEQLVPREWLARATSIQMPNDAAHRFPPGRPVEPDSALGYGYQFWMSTHGYHAGGAYSQLALVLPDSDAVLAITASTALGQPLLDAIWSYIVPALDGAPEGEHGAEADARLRARLAHLSVAPPVAGIANLAGLQGKATLGLAATEIVALDPDGASPEWMAAAAHAPQWGAEFQQALAALHAAPHPLTDPESRDVAGIVFTRTDADPSLPGSGFGGVGGRDLPEVTSVTLQQATLGVTIDGEEHSLPVAADRWLPGSLGGGIPVPFATRGGWAPDGRFEAELRMIEGPHVGYLTLDPRTSRMTFTWREPTLAGPSLVGYRA